MDFLCFFSKYQKSAKKVLTKGERCGKINELSTRRTDREAEDDQKFFKKLLKKYLTKRQRCDIIIESPRRDGDSEGKNEKVFQKTFEKPLDKS